MPNQITSIIVDDEKDGRDGLESVIISALPYVKVIAKAENAQNALEIITQSTPEIVFLDIQMPTHDGFWLVEKIHKLKIDTCIIFITAYDEYAIKAIKYAAFDLLTKPIIPEELSKTIDRYRNNEDNYNISEKYNALQSFFNRKRLKIDNHYGFILVSPEEIVYCVEEIASTEISLINGKIETVTIKLDNLIELLKDSNFVKINITTLVNSKFIEKVDYKSKVILLSDVLQRYEFKANSAGLKKLLNLDLQL